MDEEKRTLRRKLILYINRNQGRLEEQGYSVRLLSDQVKIKYNDVTYIAQMLKKDNAYYWHLEPFKGTHFTTRYDKADSLEVLLQAIKEHDSTLEHQTEN